MIVMLGGLWDCPFVISFCERTAPMLTIHSDTIVHILSRELGMNAHEAGMLLSIAGELRICQIVDPAKTCRMEISRSVTDAYEYTFR